jgi:phage shock protein A
MAIMFATAASRLQNDFLSLQNKSVDATAARPIAIANSENFQAEADTWDTYLSTLRRATADAISAKKIAQRDYLNVLAEADTWERRLEIARKNDCEDLVRKALLRRTALRDSARNLKALVEKHCVQVSTLKSQLNFWENQLAT